MRKTIRKLKGQIRGKGHSSHTTDRQAKILRETDLRVLGPLFRYDSNLSGAKIGDLVRRSGIWFESRRLELVKETETEMKDGKAKLESILA